MKILLKLYHFQKKEKQLRKLEQLLFLLSNFDMKKILIFIIITFFTITQTSLSQTKSPSNTIPSSRTLDEIKDKVASRVAELNLVEKKGVVGKVESVSD